MSALTLAALATAGKGHKETVALLVKEMLTNDLTPSTIDMLFEQPGLMVGAFSSPAVVRRFMQDAYLQAAFFRQTPEFRNKAISLLLNAPVEGFYSDIDQLAGDHRVVLAMSRMDYRLYPDWASVITDPAALAAITATDPRMLQYATAAMDAIASSPTAAESVAGSVEGRRLLLTSQYLLDALVDRRSSATAVVAEFGRSALETEWEDVLADSALMEAFDRLAADSLASTPSLIESVGATSAGRSVILRNPLSMGAILTVTEAATTLDNLLKSANSATSWSEWLGFTGSLDTPVTFRELLGMPSFVQALSLHPDALATVLADAAAVNTMFDSVSICETLAVSEVARTAVVASSVAQSLMTDLAAGKLVAGVLNSPLVPLGEVPSLSLILNDLSLWEQVAVNVATQRLMGGLTYVLGRLNEAVGRLESACARGQFALAIAESPLALEYVVSSPVLLKALTQSSGAMRALLGSGVAPEHPTNGTISTNGTNALRVLQVDADHLVSYSAGGGMMWSSDGGETWAESTGANFAIVRDVAKGDDVLFAAIGFETGKPSLIRSLDKGLTWDYVVVGEATLNGNTTITLDALAGDGKGEFLATGRTGSTGWRIFSQDNGQTWTYLVTANWQFTALAAVGDGSWLAVLSNGQIFRFADPDTKPVVVHTGTDNGAACGDDILNLGDGVIGILSTGTSVRGITRSEDNGLTWTLVDIDGTTTRARTHAVTPNGTLLTTDRQEGILRSTDKGATWTRIREPGNIIGQCHGVVASPAGFCVATFNVVPSTIAYSLDDGLTWEQVTQPHALSDFTSTLYCVKAGDRVMLPGNYSLCSSPTEAAWPLKAGSEAFMELVVTNQTVLEAVFASAVAKRSVFASPWMERVLKRNGSVVFPYLNTRTTSATSSAAANTSAGIAPTNGNGRWILVRLNANALAGTTTFQTYKYGIEGFPARFANSRAQTKATNFSAAAFDITDPDFTVPWNHVNHSVAEGRFFTNIYYRLGDVTTSQNATQYFIDMSN